MSYSQQDSRIYCIYETKTKSHEEVIIWHQDRLNKDKNETGIKAAMEADRYCRKSDYWSRRAKWKNKHFLNVRRHAG